MFKTLKAHEVDSDRGYRYCISSKSHPTALKILPHISAKLSPGPIKAALEISLHGTGSTMIYYIMYDMRIIHALIVVYAHACRFLYTPPSNYHCMVQQIENTIKLQRETLASIKFGESVIRMHWRILNLAIMGASAQCDSA